MLCILLKVLDIYRNDQYKDQQIIMQVPIHYYPLKMNINDYEIAHRVK